MSESNGPKNLTEYRKLYREDKINDAIRTEMVSDLAKLKKSYTTYRCTIWLDIVEAIADSYQVEDLIEFIKYRLNFKHGTDNDVVIKDVVLCPYSKRKFNPLKEVVDEKCNEA